MSGYLRRMLLAAVRSERRLHPMAGSVFGERDRAPDRSRAPDLGESSGSGEHQDPAESESTVGSHGLEAPVLTMPGPQRPGSAEPSSAARADLDVLPGQDAVHAMRTFREPADTTRSMRGRSDAEAKAAPVHGGSSLQDVSSRATAVSADGATLARSANVARHPVAAQAPGEPIGSNAAPTLAGGLQAWPATAHPAAPRHEAARHRRAEEPEVQVHIGRIEVLAVQPPAPSAPAPRRERTTSLADYLAGRNGRGR